MKKQITFLFALFAFIVFAGAEENPTPEKRLSDIRGSKSISDMTIPACSSQEDIDNAFGSWKNDLMDFIYSFQAAEGCSDELIVSFNNDGNLIENIPVCPGLYQNIIDLFPERDNALNNPETEHLFVENGFDPANLNLVLEEESEVYVTFLWEGAGYLNTFGYYTYMEGNPPLSAADLDLHIIFENASLVGDGGDLLPGVTRQVGNTSFPAGTVVGFFLIADAWDADNNEVGSGRHTLFTDYLLNPNELQQHVLFNENFVDGCGDLILSFEDMLRPSGDKDFNDVMFIVRTKDTPVIPVLSELTAPSICGGELTVSWSFTSTCSPAQSGEVSFVVSKLTSDDITFNLPDDVDQLFASQAELDDAFAAWLAFADVSGGCPSGTITTHPANPEAPTACGGHVEVEWKYQDDCVSFSETRTFSAQSNLPCYNIEIDPIVCHGGIGTITVNIDPSCETVTSISFTNMGTKSTPETKQERGGLLSGSTKGPAGDYLITITGANGCIITEEVTLINPPLIDVEITADGPLEFCQGGSVELTATPAESYLWSNNETSQTITVTESGSFSVTITDADGCSNSSASVEVIVNPNPVVEIMAENDGVLNCIFTEITLTAQANVPGSFLWEGPGGFTADTDAISVDMDGEYTVVFTDGNTCIASESITITEDFAVPSIQVTGEDLLTCVVDEITLTAEVDAGVTVVWDDDSTELTRIVTEPGTYTATATAPNGCSSAPFTFTVDQDITPPSLAIEGAGTLTCEVTEIILTAVVDAGVTVVWDDNSTELTRTVSQPGDYTVTATDPNNGCSSMPVTVTVVQDIATPSLSITGNETLTCEVTEITLTAVVDAGVTVVWDDNSTELTRTVSQPGDYTVTATDPNNGCSSMPVTVTVVQDIATPSLSITGNETLTCEVTEIILTAVVDAGVTVVWDDNSTELTRTVSQPGDYTVTATDPNNGCSSMPVTVTVLQDIATPSLSITGNETLTCEVTEIILTAEVDAGVTVVWDDESTELTRIVTEPGTYTATAAAPNGCSSAPVTVTVLQDLTEPSIIVTGNEVITCLVTEITLTAEVDAGVTVVWEDGSTSLTRVVTEAGIYTATATHPVSGCPDSYTVEVEANNTPPVITFESFTVCHDQFAFVLDQASPAGGTYSGIGVADGEFDPEVAGFGAHEITYSYTDPVSGCSNTAVATITVSTPIEIMADVTDLEVWGTGTGAIELTVSGGTPPYTYLWEDGEDTPSLTGLEAGDYFVTVFDDNGCFAARTITVGHNSILVDLGITIEVNIQTPDPAEVDELIFALVVTNHNEEEDATGVVVNNTIPEESLPYISRLDDGTSGSFDPASGTWVIGTIPAGEWRLLVYRTEMLLEEADNDSKSQQSAVNAAQILPFDQIDPNLDNNYAEIVISVGESTSGDDNGIESNGSMAAQLALRNHRRLVEANTIPRQERAERMTKFSRVDMLTGQVKSAKVDGQHATGIGILLPETGPANTKAFVSTPADLIGITNAKEIFSVDYLQENNARRAAILAISTDRSNVYEHTKVICDRLVGAELRDIQMMEIAGQPFIMSKLVHPGGYIDYSISFIAQQKGGEFVIDNRWYNEEYEIYHTDDIFNFQVWSVTPQFTRQLVEDILATMKENGGVSFRNEEIKPEIPQVYVHSGRYTNGGLLLNLVNTNGANQITINGSKTLSENAAREQMRLTIDIPTDEFSEVFIPTGFLFDAGFSIRNNKHNAADILYYADGAWMFDYDPGHAEVTRFETFKETNHVEQVDYNVEREASISGRVRTWATMFRTLSPRNMPVDLTGFDQIVFSAHGEGTTEVMLAKAGVNQWSEQFRTTITLTGEPTEYTIRFSDLVTREGLGGFTPEDVVSVIFNPIGNGNTASPFEVNVTNLHFANSSHKIANNAIFYPAYPNPFHRTTGFDLIITNDSHVKVEVLNMFGQVIDVIADREYTTGTYKLQWHPANHRAGVYMIRINAGTDVYTNKVIYQK